MHHIMAALLVLEIDIRERLPIGVADAKASVASWTSQGGEKRRGSVIVSYISAAATDPESAFAAAASV
jgi:hypothetical protein